MFRYRAIILAEMDSHGIRPTPDTPPELIHEFLSSLYVYEIRRLKKRLNAGLVPKADYRLEVERLRERYPLLSIPIRLWRE